jgi:hypothetical protein
MDFEYHGSLAMYTTLHTHTLRILFSLQVNIIPLPQVLSWSQLSLWEPMLLN